MSVKRFRNAFGKFIDVCTDIDLRCGLFCLIFRPPVGRPRFIIRAKVNRFDKIQVS
jgi:hypothetical protein